LVTHRLARDWRIFRPHVSVVEKDNTNLTSPESAMKFNRPSLTASGLTVFVLILSLALAGAAQQKAKPSARPSQPIADVQRDILGLSGVISRLMSVGEVPGLSIAWIRN